MPADAATALALLADLAAEEDDLDAVVAGLTEDQWRTPTPAAGWDVRDEITHLGWVEESARLAAADPDAFAKRFLEPALSDPDFEAKQMQRGRDLPGPEVLAWWRRERGAAMDALTAVAKSDPNARLPWFGPPMSLVAFTTARLMETWAHGQDVVDGLGMAREATPRLRHVCELGVRTRGWSYRVHGVEPDETPVLVRLTGPGGEVWQWGDAAAADRIDGPALDFALVVTQRRHWRETALAVQGQAAADWLDIAQAFAGRPTQAEPGRAGG
jgi:uncharacterized protein (TIGR03084 family)